MDSSIVEILPPVVDRSVTIALITTRELVLKDFAHDRYKFVPKASSGTRFVFRRKFIPIAATR